MKNKNKMYVAQIKTGQSSFETYRYKLLSHNFVINELSNKLKLWLFNKLGNNGVDEFKSFPHNAKFEGILAFIQRLSFPLNIDWLFLLSVMFYSEPGISHFSNIYTVGMDGKKINVPGVYVRYHPKMSVKEWVEEFKKAKHLSQELMYLYPDVGLEEFFKQRQKKQVGYKDESKNLDIYLAIETRISSYVQEKDQGLVEDYLNDKENKSGVSVIDRILEDLLAETLPELDDFKKMDEIKQRWRNIYYDVAERYGLPTLRDLPKYSKIIDEFAT